MKNNLSKYLDSLNVENGVRYEGVLPEIEEKEKYYFLVREKESRIYSDRELQKLPYLNRHKHSNEWKMRARSSERILNYLELKKGGAFLDLGCGNGWFTAKLSSVAGMVIGLDMNMTELKQASAVFTNKNLYFVYGDIFNMNWPVESLDRITIGAAIQYFKDFEVTINRLLKLLKENGEIHIFDSPFYLPGEIKAAKQRSLDYYTELGFQEMSNYYFHHSIEDLHKFNADLLYRPKKNQLFTRLFGKKDVPFPWVKIGKK